MLLYSRGSVRIDRARCNKTKRLIGKQVQDNPKKKQYRPPMPSTANNSQQCSKQLA